LHTRTQNDYKSIKYNKHININNITRDFRSSYTKNNKVATGRPLNISSQKLIKFLIYITPGHIKKWIATFLKYNNKPKLHYNIILYYIDLHFTFI